MREIKFRAWQDNQMVFSPLNSNYGLTRFFGFLYEDAPIMQYTGLRDKNGVEIYEGDICKVDDGRNIYEVIFYFGGFKIVVLPRKIRIYNIGDSLFKNIEVIGNIHENPELLK